MSKKNINKLLKIILEVEGRTEDQDNQPIANIENQINILLRSAKIPPVRETAIFDAADCIFPSPTTNLSTAPPTPAPPYVGLSYNPDIICRFGSRNKSLVAKSKNNSSVMTPSKTPVTPTPRRTSSRRQTRASNITPPPQPKAAGPAPSFEFEDESWIHRRIQKKKIIRTAPEPESGPIKFKKFGEVSKRRYAPISEIEWGNKRTPFLHFGLNPDKRERLEADVTTVLLTRFTQLDWMKEETAPARALDILCGDPAAILFLGVPGQSEVDEQTNSETKTITPSQSEDFETRSQIHQKVSSINFKPLPAVIRNQESHMIMTRFITECDKDLRKLYESAQLLFNRLEMLKYVRTLQGNQIFTTLFPNCTIDEEGTKISKRGRKKAHPSPHITIDDTKQKTLIDPWEAYQKLFAQCDAYQFSKCQYLRKMLKMVPNDGFQRFQLKTILKPFIVKTHGYELRSSI